MALISRGKSLQRGGAHQDGKRREGKSQKELETTESHRPSVKWGERGRDLTTSRGIKIGG